MTDQSDTSRGLAAEASPISPTEAAGLNQSSGTVDPGALGAGALQAANPSGGSPAVEASGSGVAGADGIGMPQIGPVGDPTASASVASLSQAADAGAQLASASTEAALSPWLDATLGAPAGHPAVANLIETAGNGGPVLIVLALLSIAAMTIVLVKLWQFARLRIGAYQPVDRALALWYQHRPEEAIAELAGRPQPTARLVHRTMTGLQAACTDVVLLREELTRFGLDLLEQLRGGLRALEVIATLSPLLGLLGTVLGMIEAFRELEQAGSQVDPSTLSGGIWQALLTTAAGLAVAIPVVMLHAWLERKVDAQGHRMDDAVTRVFTRDLSRPPRSHAEGPEPASTAGAEVVGGAV